MGEAARKEGSMEDILASIRRIITSDSEKVEKPTPSQKPDAAVKSEATPPSPVSSQPQAPAMADKPKLSDLAARITASKPDASASETQSSPLNGTPEGSSVSQPGSLAEMARKMRADEAALTASPQASEEKPTDSLLRPTLSDMEVAEIDQPVEAEQESPAKSSASLPETPVGSFSRFAETVLDKPSTSPKVEPAGSPAEASASGIESDEPAAEPQSLAKTETDEPVTTMPPVSALPDVDKPQDTATPDPEPEANASVKTAPLPPQGHRNDVAASFREALVSPSTAQSVIGSMDRLRKSVSDQQAAIAEAAMRPMLKEWLDANLPAMVEKMVREEIDRISETSAREA